MRHHAERVHAGIRAAGAVDTRLAGKKFSQRFLDLLLYAGPGFLRLPPFVIRPVVRDGEFEFERVHVCSLNR